MKNSDWPVLHMADRQFIQSPSTFFGFAIPNVCYRLLSTWKTYGSADLSSSSTRWKSRPQFVCPKAVNQIARETNFTQVRVKGNRKQDNRQQVSSNSRLCELYCTAWMPLLLHGERVRDAVVLSRLPTANLLWPSLTDKQHQRSHYHSSNIHRPTVTLINSLQASLAR